MFPCLYDERQHEILDTEVGRWCQRNAPADWKDRLFTYRHQLHNTFVVAVWAAEPFGILSDVLNLGHSLSNFDRGRADEMMKRMWCPLQADDMARQIESQSKDFQHQEMGRAEEYKEYLAKRKEAFK